MKNFIRYPRSNSELNKMMQHLDRNLSDTQKLQNKQIQSREWMRICQAINDIHKEALIQVKSSNDKYNQAKQSLSMISIATSTLDHNFHTKVINIVEKWMRTNKFPIW